MKTYHVFRYHENGGVSEIADFNDQEKAMKYLKLKREEYPDRMYQIHEREE